MLATIAVELGAHNVDVRAERARTSAAAATATDSGSPSAVRWHHRPWRSSCACRWCDRGGRLVIWAGETDAAAIERAALAVAGELQAIEPAPGDRRSFVVVVKTGPTPERFPRRPGMAAKRPLAG